VSASLLARYNDMRGTSGFLDTQDSRRAWLDAVHVLEAACFFDPQNARAREDWLRLRWNNYVAGNSLNQFAFARRRSEAWGKYVDQFGLPSGPPGAGEKSIAAEYVLSAWRPFEMFRYASENQREWGIPQDAGLAEVTGWRNQLGSEFITRLLAVPDDPALSPSKLEFFYHALTVESVELRSQLIAKVWPQILAIARKTPVAFNGAAIVPLRRHFEEIGQPGGEEKLLAELRQANQERTPVPAPPPKIKLPQVSELVPDNSGDIFSLRPIRFPIPLATPDVKVFPFPKEHQVQSVKSLACYDGVLWMLVEVSEQVKVENQHDLADKNLAPIFMNRTQLWRLAPDQAMPQPFGGPLATNVINWIMRRGEVLWLALNDEGIAALNLNTGVLKRYESSAGIRSLNQVGLADAGRGIVAIGGFNALLFLDNGTETWKPFSPALPFQSFTYGAGGKQLASSINKVLLYNSQLMLCDLSSNLWTRIADKAAADSLGRIERVESDERGHFWILADAGLHEIEDGTGEVRSLWLPLSPTIRNTVPAGVPEAAWPMYHNTDQQLVQAIRQLLLIRKPSPDAGNGASPGANRFVPGNRLAGRVLAMAPDGEFDWFLVPGAVLLYHPMSRSFAGGFSLDHAAPPFALTCGGGKVWTSGNHAGEIVIMKFDGTALKSTPRERWLADKVSREELAVQIAALPSHEQAIFDFFAGDDSAAIRQLLLENEAALDGESLFLLATAYAETGEAGRAAHFQDDLRRNFPDSVFLKVPRRTMPPRAAVEPPNK
jgi:hypothetical protein